MDSRDFVEKTRVLRPLATLLLVNSLLLAPIWMSSGRLGPHLLALEAAVVTGLFMLLPARTWTRVLAWVVAVAILAVSLLALADATMRISLARPLNLYLDVRLASAVSNLLRGTLGTATGVVVMVVGAGLAAALAVGLARLLSAIRAEATSGYSRAAGAVLLGVSLVAVPVRWLHPGGIVLALPAVRIVHDQSALLLRMLRERERFAAEMAGAPSSYAFGAGLLEGLGGRDVIMAFVESYGMSAVDDARYAPVVRPRLDAMAERLREAGLHMATGALVAPSQGGMSWLGHGSILSGLWLENQLRYDLLLAGDRGTLIDDFEAAGYRTVALMPAITLAWPEGERFGYERIYAYDDIDYAGPALNWVTMPDQYTWSFLESTVRVDDDDRPLFAELGLISSHAPWTPILSVHDDWGEIGNGTIFEPWGMAGERPEQLWLDTERVREHYALAVGYAVDVLASYAARYVDAGTLLIALGDHQPAPLITGEDAGRAVPVHVITGERAMLDPFLRWGFVEGALPDATSEAPRMDAFRDWFVTAFSSAQHRPGL